jgi:hypothetical protein
MSTVSYFSAAIDDQSNTKIWLLIRERCCLR